MALFTELSTRVRARLTRHLPVSLLKPIRVAIEVTNRCNLNCPFCLVGMQDEQVSVAHNDLNRPWGQMDLGLADKIVGNAKAFGIREIMLAFQGEPLMHRGFVDFVKITKKHGLRSIVFTNGLLLDRGLCRGIIEAGLDRMQFSVDGATQETYQQNRVGGKFAKAYENMRLMMEAKAELRSGVEVGWQYIVLRNNEHEIELARELAGRIGIPLILKTFAESVPEMAPRDPRYRRKLLGKPCRDIYRTAFTYWNGDVVPCCYDQAGKEIMGNLAQQTFQEIWQGPRYRRFREALEQAVERPEEEPLLCKSCLKWTHPSRFPKGEQYLADDPDAVNGEA